MLFGHGGSRSGNARHPDDNEATPIAGTWKMAQNNIGKIRSGENQQGGAGTDILDMGSGDDTGGNAGDYYNIILGGSGDEDITAEGLKEDVFGGSGDDTITFTGLGGLVYGGTGNDTLLGSNHGFSRDDLYGGAGNDIIDGRGGADDIYGGAGDDDLTGGSGADVFHFSAGHGNDTIRDFNAAGGDKISLRGFDKTITWEELRSKFATVTDPNDDTAVTGVQIDLSDWGGGTVTLKGVTSVSDLTSSMFYGLDKIAGGDGNDYLEGGSSDDTLTGGGGADTFTFVEGHGNDTIADFDIARDKIDLCYFDHVITWAQLQAAMTDVADDVQTTGVDETATVIDLSQWGGGTITLKGVTSSQLTAGNFDLYSLEGGDGNDWIAGGTSDDTMSGGGGADTFVFVEESGADTITDFDIAKDKINLCYFEAAISWEDLQAAMTAVGDDTQTSDVDETATIIDLSDWGGGTITLEGVAKSSLTAKMFLLPNGYARSYEYGDSDDNTIDGGAGNDTVFGQEGNDALTGGKGADWLFGGEGDDTLDGGEGDDLLLGGEGADTLTGGGGDDELVGGEGNDTLTGGAGADTFAFGDDGGNDTITDFDTANDNIHLTMLSQTVTWGQLQSKIATVTDPDDANVVTGLKIDLSDFGGGTIVLQGLTSVSDLTEDMFVLDRITGGSGNDTLRGGSSDDTMTGGAGNDTMTGNDGDDTFVFASGHGNDTVTDFTDGEDLIDLTAFTGITGFGDLTVTQVGDDVKIDLSGQTGGGSITLQDFTLADLGATDFVFYEAPPDGG